MATNEPQLEETSGSDLVSVSDWDACYNSLEDIISLSCTVTTKDSRATISAVGLLFNTEEGAVLGATYTDFSSDSESASPALNLPPGRISVGDTVMGVVTGEVDGLHYFFEQKLTVGTCE